MYKRNLHHDLGPQLPRRARNACAHPVRCKAVPYCVYDTRNPVGSFYFSDRRVREDNKLITFRIIIKIC